ncbi:MAG: lytic transglycosylase domain-containing protein [Deltaproteobacteria bacterium]|nr:lytic transglycosylase domain-containing protein [Deltaproteobacteria bacterium]
MTRFSRLVLLVVGVAPVVMVSSRGDAEIWNRTQADGTVEFTNRPRARAGAATEAGAASGGGTFWARERSDGVVEFTNLRPVGGKWKVWLKTGPGKAGALRGSTDAVPPRDGSVSRYSRYDQDIRDQQLYYGIPEAFIRAVMKVESDFDPLVVSSVGAQGLMQLMPGTARQMGVTDSFDPRQNIMGGARYLQVLARRFCHTPSMTDDDGGAADRALVCSDEEKIKVLAGYHAGPGAVEKYGGMPPYETTRAYVTMVLRRYEQYRRGPAAHAGAFLPER